MSFTLLITSPAFFHSLVGASRIFLSPIIISTGMLNPVTLVFNGKDEWLTPPEIINCLGPFDLDPCSPIDRPWDTAERHLTILDDGLVSDWGNDFVWCNPPYGTQTWKWLDKLSRHPGGGIALIFARTETVGFFSNIWSSASSLLFLKGRLSFYHVDGHKADSAGAPSVLVGYGNLASDRILNSGISGGLS